LQPSGQGGGAPVDPLDAALHDMLSKLPTVDIMELTANLQKCESSTGGAVRFGCLFAGSDVIVPVIGRWLAALKEVICNIGSRGVYILTLFDFMIRAFVSQVAACFRKTGHRYLPDTEFESNRPQSVRG
jgi:hypothetical protein